jgi:phosphatidylglycerophosphate synthase
MGGLRNDPLVISIGKTIGLYCGIETLLFFLISLIYRFRGGLFLLFLGIQSFFNLIVLLYLISRRHYFFIVATGERLTRVNGANKITLFRITMLPLLLCLILAAQDYPLFPVLLPLIILTFLTDIADGLVSRINRERTFIGQILDSAGDYLVLGLMAIIYSIFKLLPVWIFLLILFRLLFHALCMTILYRVRKKLEPRTTLFGKIAIASMMVLFVAEAAGVILPRIRGFIIYVEIAAGALTGLSVIDKAVYFVTRCLAPPTHNAKKEI